MIEKVASQSRWRRPIGHCTAVEVRSYGRLFVGAGAGVSASTMFAHRPPWRRPGTCWRRPDTSWRRPGPSWRSWRRPCRDLRPKALDTAPDIPFEVVPNFMKLPPNVYMGEGIGVATNSKGHIFVNTCAQQTRNFEFDQNGNYVREIGKDLLRPRVLSWHSRRCSGQHLGDRRGRQLDHQVQPRGPGNGLGPPGGFPYNGMEPAPQAAIRLRPTFSIVQPTSLLTLRATSSSPTAMSTHASSSSIRTVASSKTPAIADRGPTR